MNRPTRKVLATAGVAAALAAAGAVAANPSAQAAPNRATAAKVHKLVVRAHVLRAGLKYIGVTGQQLRQELPGHSLAQVAVAHGKTVAGLEAAMLAAAKKPLDKAVAAGKRTQAQEDAVLARLAARIDKLVNHVFPSK
jgi:hypothetical protein